MKIFMVSILMFLAGFAFSQTDEPEETEMIERITYVGTIPGNLTETKSKKPFRKLWQLVVGSQDVTLRKPVGVIPVNETEFLVLDQGVEGIVQVKDGVFKPVKLGGKQFGSLPSPVGMCDFKNEGILFTESGFNQIFYMSKGGAKAEVWNEELKLVQPTGILYVKEKKQVWVVETPEHRISILNEKGEKIKEIGERGTGERQFNFPTFLAKDDEGNIFLVDAMNFRVQILDLEGNFKSMFGRIGNSSGNFTRPKGIALDSDQNLYIVDMLFHTVQIFDKEGNLLYNFGSEGSGEQQFYMPSGIYIDEKDRIYVADSYNSRIQVFQYHKDSR